MEYRTIAHFLGVGVSTACVVVHDMCKLQSNCRRSSDKNIKILTGNHAMDIVHRFEAMWSSQCFGATEGVTYQ